MRMREASGSCISSSTRMNPSSCSSLNALEHVALTNIGKQVNVAHPQGHVLGAMLGQQDSQARSIPAQPIKTTLLLSAARRIARSQGNISNGGLHTRCLGSSSRMNSARCKLFFALRIFGRGVQESSLKKGPCFAAGRNLHPGGGLVYGGP